LMYALEHYQELDTGYKKTQGRKFRAFVTCAVVSLSCFILATGFRFLETKTTNDSYDRLVKTAESSTDETDMIENYKKAIELDPSKKDAYEGLLENAYLADNNFKDSEQQELRQIIQDTGDGTKQNIQYLEEDSEGYSEFAYNVGLAYFFNYQGNGNKGYAAPWFNDVIARNKLDSERMNLATSLGRMANYYSELNKINDSGETQASYNDYWVDLSDLTEGNLTEKTNAITALRMYREVVSQVETNGLKFKEAGVTKRDITAKLDDIESRVKSDVNVSSQANSEKAVELKNDIDTTMTLARRDLEITYSAAAGSATGGN